MHKNTLLNENLKRTNKEMSPQPKKFIWTKFDSHSFHSFSMKVQFLRARKKKVKPKKYFLLSCTFKTKFSSSSTTKFSKAATLIEWPSVNVRQVSNTNMLWHMSNTHQQACLLFCTFQHAKDIPFIIIYLFILSREEGGTHYQQ